MRMDECQIIIEEYKACEQNIEELTKVALSAILYSKVVKQDLIVKAVQILFKSNTDFITGTPSRTKEYVGMRRVYYFIRYLFLDEHIQVVADEMNLTRANIYHHCQVMFDLYDTNVDFRKFMLLLFDKETIEKMRDKFNCKKWKI